jgi:cell division protein FtsB
MRLLTLTLVILIAALQYPLWLGKGSWLRVWDLSRQIEQQKAGNEVLKLRNDALDAEVRDLKTGYAAIEERARSELGMIRQDEVFYQVMENAPAPQPRAAASPPAKPAAPAKP